MTDTATRDLMRAALGRCSAIQAEAQGLLGAALVIAKRDGIPVTEAFEHAAIRGAQALAEQAKVFELACEAGRNQIKGMDDGKKEL